MVRQDLADFCRPEGPVFFPLQVPAGATDCRLQNRFWSQDRGEQFKWDYLCELRPHAVRRRTAYPVPHLTNSYRVCKRCRAKIDPLQPRIRVMGPREPSVSWLGGRNPNWRLQGIYFCATLTLLPSDWHLGRILLHLPHLRPGRRWQSPCHLNRNRPFLGTPDPPAPIEAGLHRGIFSSAFNFLQISFHILHC